MPQTACSWPTGRRTSNAYALFNLQERPEPFIGAGVEVYEGMIVRENTPGGDTDVNATNEKLTNIRTHTHDEALRPRPPRLLTVEAAIEFSAGDGLVEVTPASIRLASGPTTGAASAGRGGPAALLRAYLGGLTGSRRRTAGIRRAGARSRLPRIGCTAGRVGPRARPRSGCPSQH